MTLGCGAEQRREAVDHISGGILSGVGWWEETERKFIFKRKTETD
jgi:hypothetical protein